MEGMIPGAVGGAVVHGAIRGGRGLVAAGVAADSRLAIAIAARAPTAAAVVGIIGLLIGIHHLATDPNTAGAAGQIVGGLVGAGVMEMGIRGGLSAARWMGFGQRPPTSAPSVSAPTTTTSNASTTTTAAPVATVATSTAVPSVLPQTAVTPTAASTIAQPVATAARTPDPGLAAFVARLRAAGIQVRATNVEVYEANGTVTEVDVVTDNALIQYKSGTASARDLIDQVRNTESYVSRVVVAFVEGSHRGIQRTIQHSANNGVLCTSDFDTLVSLIR